MKKLLNLLFLLTIAGSLYAQEVNLTGNVSDANGPLAGASIMIEKTKTGTVTDVNGNYSLNVKPGDVLVFSYIGFTTQTIPYKGEKTLNIKLEESVSSVSEVVVVGYGVQKKATLTGAVSAVSGENLTKRTVASLSTGLQGLMPGVTVMQTSGQPGADGASIRVRGIGSINSTLSPLVLVDGIETDINQIDMNSVETISVLKDAASASIYGSRASNGVILITTKRGAEGTVNISYNGYVTLQRPTNMPEVLPAWEYLQAERQAKINNNADITPEQDAGMLKLIEEHRLYKPDNWTRYDTDWREETLKDNSIMHSHSVSANGGTKKMRFYGVGTYLYQDGMVPNNDYNRTNLRLNADIQPYKWLKIGVEASMRQNNITTPNASTPANIIKSCLQMLPTLSAAVELDGHWGYGKNGDNPTAKAKASGINKSKNSEVMANGTVTITPIKDLEILGQYSLRSITSRTRNLSLPYETYLRGIFMGRTPRENSLNEGLSEGTRNYYRAQASYGKQIKEHEFKILVGMQAEDQTTTSLQGGKKGFELDRYYLGNGDPLTATSGGTATSWAMMSYFGRINYNYAEKYLFEATGRYDGSSRFTKNNRWGFFPSVSAGWVLSREEFMEKTTDILDQLKVRASFGQLGNQDIGNYPYAATIDAGYGYWFDKDIYAGVVQKDLANPNIGWEKSEQFNVGVDATLWNGKLSVTADYYIKTIYDMLLKFPLPYYTGLGYPYQNAGDMKNKGWEISLSHKNKIGEFSYGVTFTLNDNRNKITNLNGLLSQDMTMQVGYPRNGIWGYLTDGYYKDAEDVANSPTYSNSARPGFVKYKKTYTGEDANPNQIETKDRVYLGDPFPHFEYGLTLNGSWKNIDLSIFIQGVGKRDVVISGVGIKPFAGGGNLYRHQMDSWTEDNPNAAWPILLPDEASGDNFLTSDKWVRNGAYCRLKNVVLGYTLPEHISKKFFVNNLRFYVSGQNLLSISNFYKGFNPEVNYSNGAFYPIMQTFTFGLDLKF